MFTATKLAEKRVELREQVEECWAKAASAFRRGDLASHTFFADAAGRLSGQLADVTELHDMLAWG